jgi:hypothetical protein
MPQQALYGLAYRDCILPPIPFNSVLFASMKEQVVEATVQNAEAIHCACYRGWI